MLAIVGTVPDPDFPLLTGPARIEKGSIRLEGEKIPVNRGTPAMLAAALKACEVIESSGVLTCLVGDIGTGQGSRRLYEHLAQGLDWQGLQAIAFHYLQPDADWHNRVLFAVEEMNPRPVLIADAGFMYAAKMSGQAAKYDLFTPDVGELAFLADEQAPHPFYTRGFILHEENRVPDLITRSYDHGNAARHLLVKGKKDYLARDGEIVDTVAEPIVEAMEA
ncbi:MAG: sugar kinase, partial [Desulfarculaceae bacterium]